MAHRTRPDSAARCLPGLFPDDHSEFARWVRDYRRPL